MGSAAPWASWPRTPCAAVARGQRSPLAGVVSEQRRVATVPISLADLKAIRDEHHHTINDVVLAVVAGGSAGLAADPRRES